MNLTALAKNPTMQLELTPNKLLTEEKIPVANCNIITESVIKRPIGKRNIVDLRRKESAAVALKELERDGCELFGLTKGQFSLTDMIRAIIEKPGPAALTISTWTAAKADVTQMMELLSSGQITSCRWLVDLTFVRRCPSLAQEIRQKFGDDAIRVTKTHAKFCTIVNNNWKVALRSSMNLNQNPRLESFQVGHDPELCCFLDKVVTEIWKTQRRELAEAMNSELTSWWHDQG